MLPRILLTTATIAALAAVSTAAAAQDTVPRSLTRPSIGLHGANALTLTTRGSTALGGGHEFREPSRSHTEHGSRASSPYHRSLGRDGILLGAALGGAGLASSLEGRRTELTEEQASRLTRASVNWFDRSATSRYSPDLVRTSENVASVLAYAPLALLIDSRARGDWPTLGLMYVQTTLLSSGAANLTKGTVHRYRPYVYNADLSYEQKTAKNPGGAFFSSAATYAFARAVFISTVFSDYHPESHLKPLVWAGSLGTAAVVGYLRYESGLHYPSDVIVGALVGSAIGYAVPRLHRTGDRGVSVAPSLVDGQIGARAEIRF